MMKILIIDDEPHIIRALTLLLKRSGYEVVSAYNGAVGLEKLCTERPDIVIVDVFMPQVTGLELLYQWNSQTPESENIQFIMLTASCDEAINTCAERFENVQLVAKPFSPRQLLHMVQETATKISFKHEPV